MSQMSIDNERLTLDTCFELQEYNDEDEDDSTDEEDEDIESAVLSSVSTQKQVLYHQSNKTCCYAPKSIVSADKVVALKESEEYSSPKGIMPVDEDALLNEYEEYIKKEKRNSQLKLTIEKSLKESQNKDFGCLLHGDCICKICF